MGILFALVASLLPLAPAPSDDGAPPPNVLVIIADDLGVDRVGAYGEHPNPGNTPVLDQLAADGLLFRNAWSNPVCSATRATLLTGRYSFRTGIGLYLQPADDVELTLDENTIPKVLPPEYRKVAVGKWHLSGMAASGAQHPMLMGFEHHHGSLFNLDEGQSYFAWDKNVDGQVETSTTYATTDAVDEALAFISQFSAQPEPEPWFMWLASNAPHSPYHHPPEQLHSFSLPSAINKPPLFAKAATEAMDTEIGRLLSTMDPAVLANTYVIFLGDNGTQQEASTAPFTGIHAKNTTYEGGVNVPLIVKGPGVVAGAECAALVNTVDLFETVMDIVGVDAGTQDSESMFPYFASPDLPSVRGYVYADMFAPDKTLVPSKRERTVRDERFKLRRVLGAPDTLHDLLADPFETNNLLAAGPLGGDAAAALEELDSILDDLDPILGKTWTKVGYGLPGANGIPALSGVGTLQPGEPFTLRVIGGPGNAALLLYLGNSYIVEPFKGGTLVPKPQATIAGVTDMAGAYSLAGTWPETLASGTTVYYQAWLSDPAAVQGSSATNGLAGTTGAPAND